MEIDAPAGELRHQRKVGKTRAIHHLHRGAIDRHRVHLRRPATVDLIHRPRRGRLTLADGSPAGWRSAPPDGPPPAPSVKLGQLQRRLMLGHGHRIHMMSGMGIVRHRHLAMQLGIDLRRQPAERCPHFVHIAAGPLRPRSGRWRRRAAYPPVSPSPASRAADDDSAGRYSAAVLDASSPTGQCLRARPPTSEGGGQFAV